MFELQIIELNIDAIIEKKNVLFTTNKKNYIY